MAAEGLNGVSFYFISYELLSSFYFVSPHTAMVICLSWALKIALWDNRDGGKRLKERYVSFHIRTNY